MRVCIWGAGNIGASVAHRLAAQSCVSEIHWINRDVKEVQLRAIDLEHGLAFAPSCHTVNAYNEEDAEEALRNSDLAILTHGTSVRKGKNRQDVWRENRDIFRELAIPTLLKVHPKFILVVTKPVDSLARLTFEECGTKDDDRARRVFGLGTIVDTARLRSAVGRYLTPVRAAREVNSVCVGTHDPLVIPLANGESISASVLDLARREVVEGANRVKLDDEHGRSIVSSRSPIAEGVAQLVDALANDTKAILTPSIRRNPHFYSVPCVVGAGGIEGTVDAEIPARELDACKKSLAEMWEGTP